jgi:vacuolar-type H+-ATPase subunit H
MAIAAADLVLDIKALRHQEMQRILGPGHGDIEQPAFFLDFLALAGASTSSSTTTQQVPSTGYVPATPPTPGKNDQRFPSESVDSSETSGSSGTISSLTKRAGDVATDAAGSVSEAARSVTDTVSTALSGAGDAANESFAHVADVGADLGARAKNTFLDALEREPLVIGALGVAVGAAIGAMLPTTRAEQEYLGTAGSEARKTAEQTLSEGVDRAKQVAGDVYSAARDEADRQASAPAGKTSSEKMAEIAKAAGSELKKAADETVDQTENKMDRTADRLSTELKSTD